MLKEGYTLPFQSRPSLSLTRSPKLSTAMYGTYIGYRHYISLWTKMQWSQFKISGLLQPFLVPKPHNRCRPILGLSKPNLSETIRTTLQQGEWVTLIDFKDAYFNIPIQEQSRKYLRFHVQGRTYQFKALSFGLSTAPWSSL